jgi:two-component system alkaline phosphatase synthesis response regulator PhoP
MTKHIIVVDDDPVVRLLAEEYLRRMGHEVESVENGSSFLERVHEKLPDIVFLDMMLPDMTGIDILRQLKSDPRTAKLPVAMLSAEPNSASIVSSYNLNADFYLEKPFRKDDLEKLLEPKD